MKRLAALLPLSREHHEALVLARRACDPTRPDARPGPLREHLLRRWSESFESHFAVEEQVLLPALRAAGAAEEAGEALRQHDALRQCIARLRRGDLAALPRWGEAMRDHVRWEERHLFGRAEALLDLDALAARLTRMENPNACSDSPLHTP